MHRRWFLGAVPAAGLGRAARAESPLSLTASPPDRVLVQGRAAFGAVSLPAARCRMLATASFGPASSCLVAFAADQASRATCDVLAVVADDGLGLRLAALELLSWHDGVGRHLFTRPALVPDGRRLLLARDAAAPGPHRLTWRREVWADILAWSGGGTLQDAPLRPPLPGTWQHGLSAHRGVVAAALAATRVTAPDPLLTLVARWPEDTGG